MRIPSPRSLLPALASALALLLAASAGAPASADEIRTLEGDLDAELEAIEEGRGGDLVFVTDRGRFAAGAVREVRFSGASPVPLVGKARLFLRTGGEIPGALEEAPPDLVGVRSPTLGKLQIPLDLVRGVTFAAEGPDVDRFRREVVPADPELDLLVLSSWERKRGTIEVIGPGGVEVELGEVGMVTLGPDRLVGVRLAPLTELQPREGMIAHLDLACGGRVSGRLRYMRGGALAIDAPFERALRLHTRFVSGLFLEGGGRFAYLSDLAPAEVEQRNQVIDVAFPWQRDASVTGEPLRLGGRSYRKGIGAKAYTRLVYGLGGRYGRLRALIGIDDSARGRHAVRGSAVFQVLADGRPLLGEGGVLLTSDDPPRRIDIPLEGVERLELVADFGPSGDVLARAAWADAYLVR